MGLPRCPLMTFGGIVAEELTPSQEKAIEEIRQVFPSASGEVVRNDDGTVDFEIAGATYVVGKRGKYELRAEPVEKSEPSVPETGAAAEPSAEDAPVQTSGEDGVAGNGPAPTTSGASASSPVETSNHERTGVDSGASGLVASPGSQVSPGEGDLKASGHGVDRNGAEASLGRSASAPTTSVEPGVLQAQTVPEESVASENEVTEAQDSPGGALPSLPGEPVPTFDQLPQVHRQEAYEALSLADERQVTAELEGRALSSMVYGFKVGDQQVFGLSWIGAREVVRAFNARTKSEIRISDSTPPVFEDVMAMTVVGWDDDAKKPIKEERPAIRCTVYGMDAATGSGQWGTATVPRDQIIKAANKKEGQYYGTTPDGFASNKALSKAQRNALEPMIPRDFVEELIALYKGQNKVEYIPGTGRDVTPELPPALTDDRAKGLMDRCRELYAEFKKQGGAKHRPPAWFQQQLTAAQHDHKLLEDLVAALEDMNERLAAANEKQANG